MGRGDLSQSCAVAALALHNLVALLDQALAFAILALGLLLDVRAFFIGHDGLQGKARPPDCKRRRVERYPAINTGIAQLESIGAEKMARSVDEQGVVHHFQRSKSRRRA